MLLLNTDAKKGLYMMLKILAPAFLISTLLVAPAFAQDSGTMQNPHIEKIKEKAKALSTTMTAEEAKDLGLLREAFGMIQSVYLVRDHVSTASTLCKKEHKDLKSDIGARFDTWELRVISVADHQQEVLDDAINNERFQNPGDIKEYLELIDDAAEYADAQLKKQPLITLDACKSLLDSMSTTQEELVSLLGSITWPEGVDQGPLPDTPKAAQKPEAKKPEPKAEPPIAPKKPEPTPQPKAEDVQEPAADITEDITETPATETEKKDEASIDEAIEDEIEAAKKAVEDTRKEAETAAKKIDAQKDQAAKEEAKAQKEEMQEDTSGMTEAQKQEAAEKRKIKE